MSSVIDSQFLNVSPSGDYLNKSNGIVFTISAPGKVILHGEHSAVYSKLALAASLGLRTSLTLREKESSDDISAIELHFPDVNLHYSFNFKEVQNLLDKTLPTKSGISSFSVEYPQNLDHELHLKNIEGFLSEANSYQNLNEAQKHSLTTFLYLFVAIFGSLNVNLRPFHLSLSSQLTLGAGTGSSASFVVCLVASLIHYLKFIVRRGELSDNLSKTNYAPTKLTIDSSSAAFSREELPIISEWAFHGEKIHHGTPSGIDNTVCTYGSLVAFKKGSAPELKRMSYPLKLIMINTKVSRDTKALVSKVGEFKKKYPRIADHIMEAMDELSITALECIETLNESGSNQDVVAEEFVKLGELAEVNHGLLSVLGVSHPTLEYIMETLKRHGLKGKLTGAGGGGYAICLVPPHFLDKELDLVLAILISSGYDAKMTILGDDGVRVDV